MGKIKILIIDDDQFVTEFIQAQLKKIDYEVDVANSAIGLDYDDLHSYNAILLDVIMPEVSGLDVLQNIRQKYDNLQLPVILMSSLNEVDDVVVGFEHGANDYLIKPINLKIALTRITTQLKLVEMSQFMASRRETDAVHAMIATYNHQINNPLALAIGSLEDIKEDPTNAIAMERLENGLDRIHKIVKEIYALLNKEKVRFEQYVSNVNMVKVSSDEEE